MDMETFAGEICAAVEKNLGREFRAEVREVRKNNGVLLHGLLQVVRGRAGQDMLPPDRKERE